MIDKKCCGIVFIPASFGKAFFTMELLLSL